MDVSSILKKYPKHKDSLIEILHDIQNHDPQNHLTADSLRKVANYLSMPLAQVYGVTGYYSMFCTTPRSRHTIYLCKSPVCAMLGGQSIFDILKLKVDSNPSLSKLITLERVECLGQCDKSPCIMVNKTVYGNLTPEKVDSIIDNLLSSEKS